MHRPKSRSHDLEIVERVNPHLGTAPRAREAFLVGFVRDETHLRVRFVGVMIRDMLSVSAEAEMEEDFKDARSMDDVERVAAKRLEKQLKERQGRTSSRGLSAGTRRRNPGFQDLATGLQLRLVRAAEHWRGNTHLTLTAIIVRMVEEGNRTRGSSPA